MGNSVLKVCVRGSTSKINGKNAFIIDELGFYLKDTYDFVDESNTPEPLGIWSKNRVLDKKESAIYMSSYLSGFFGDLARIYSGFVPVFNHDFRLWQKKHGTGGDYIILSDVLWAKVEESDKVIFFMSLRIYAKIITIILISGCWIFPTSVFYGNHNTVFENSSPNNTFKVVVYKAEVYNLFSLYKFLRGENYFFCRL